MGGYEERIVSSENPKRCTSRAFSISSLDSSDRPWSRLCLLPQVFATYPNEDYDRRNEDVDPMAASAEYELEKRVERLELFPVELEKGFSSVFSTSRVFFLCSQKCFQHSERLQATSLLPRCINSTNRIRTQTLCSLEGSDCFCEKAWSLSPSAFC